VGGSEMSEGRTCFRREVATMKHSLVCLAAILACMPAVDAFAQTTATVSGTVWDQGGGVIPGAELAVTNLDTQQSREIKTDSSGLYYAPALGSGNYKITV